MAVMRRGQTRSFMVWVLEGRSRQQVWRGGYRTKRDATAAERRFLVDRKEQVKVRFRSRALASSV